MRLTQNCQRNEIGAGKEKEVFIVSREKQGRRLDVYLGDELKERGISRVHIQRLIKEEKVLVNGVVNTKLDYRVKEGEEITLFIQSLCQEKKTLTPEPLPLDILYEDAQIIIVNKPAGMVVHPGKGNYFGTLANALLAHCQSLSGMDKERPGIVHRLDKDTSGLLVIAKTERAHQYLAKQFKERQVERRYIVLVRGVVRFDEGRITQPIGRDIRNWQKMAIDIQGKEAITIYRVLQRYAKYTLLELQLETGRTHQIRVHLAYLGYPVAGDRIYGGKEEKPVISRQAVHSSKLGFYHPETKEFVQFCSSLPEDMQEAIRRCALQKE
ncbi:MAG: RNA pseudouridine synthase [Candidatus Omnitrophota bacterium]|nr:MAG: RNA pseudouridine synthase [Candidatus Omnitrophota bacterium]